MTRILLATTLLGVFTSTASVAVNLVGPALYASNGVVAANNGQASCAQVNLTVGAPANSVLFYPGAGKTGLKIYIPLAGAEQLCIGFAAVPAGGLDGLNSNATCTVYSPQATIPTKGVNFVFSSTTIDANSGIGSTLVTIPANAPIGAGCQATVATTIVRSGK